MGACVGSSSERQANQPSGRPQPQPQYNAPQRSNIIAPPQPIINRNFSSIPSSQPIPISAVNTQQRYHLQVYLRKNTFELHAVHKQPGTYSLNFEFDALDICVIEVYYFAVENLDATGKNTLNFCVDAKLFPTPQSFRFNPGMKQKFPENISLIAPAKYNKDLLTFKNKINVPLTVNIRNEDPTNLQSQTNFYTIEIEGDHYKLGLIRQKLSLSKKSYLLNEIYNLELREGECVICLEEKSTVASIPCKHCCLCEGCSEKMRKDPQMKCPICRAPVEKFIKMELNE